MLRACNQTMAAATITTDHDEIKRWVEERGGFPVRMKIADDDPDDPHAIRVDFNSFAGQGSLEPISWDEWFDAFERAELAFLHQEETEDGQLSHFNEVVSRASVERARPRALRRVAPAAHR
jgi:hypothetical protein